MSEALNKLIEEITQKIIDDPDTYIPKIFEGLDLEGNENELKALCPFPDHKEKTPSFSYNKSKALFYCFGCHAGGNVFQYVMRTKSIKFYEALKILGDMTGVEITKQKFTEGVKKINGLTRNASKALGEYEKTPEDHSSKEEKWQALQDAVLESPKGADLNKTFEAYFKEACERSKEELIGLQINNFSKLTKKLDGLQDGLYIVGAYSNVGKTAFLTNLFLETVKENPSARVLFYSLDDSKKTVFTRLLTYSVNRSLYDNDHKGRHSINELKKLKGDETLKNLAVNNYSNADNKNNLLQFFEEGRLRIYDSEDIESIEDLEDEITKHRSDIQFNYPNIKKLVIFIDALYDLPIETEAEGGGIREKNIERATKIKALSTAYNLPIITTAELRKKDSKNSEKWDYEPTIDAIMETGKYIYKADVIFLLSPNFKHYENEEDFTKARDEENKISVYLKFAKNKLSGYKGKLYFDFHTLYNMIIETDKPEDAKRTEKPKRRKLKDNHDFDLD